MTKTNEKTEAESLREFEDGDADNVEWTEEEFAAAKSLEEINPELVAAIKRHLAAQAATRPADIDA